MGTIALLGLLLISLSTFGQEPVADAPEGATKSASSKSDHLPFVASLVQIKADWSQLPAAKEIEAELRKALTGEEVPAELLKGLPATGSAILFPLETASRFSQEHFAQLLAWLKAKQIILNTEVIPSESVQLRMQMSFSSGAPYTAEVAHLTKNSDFLGLNLSAASGNQSFIARAAELTWAVQNHFTLNVQCNLTLNEKARGEEKPKVESQQSSNFTTAALQEGQVVVVPAFASRGDWTQQSAAKAKGFDLLLVVEQRSPGEMPVGQPRLVLPDKVERLKVNRTQNAGLNVFGQAPSFTNPSAGSAPRSITSDNIMLSWSEGKDVAWGFSKSLGKWAKQELNPPATEARPILDSNLGVWQVGSTYYGFSGESGRWDVLHLPVDHKPPAILDGKVARVHDGDDIYTFAGSTGRWSSPKGNLETAESKPDESRIKVFTLRHIPVRDAERIMNQLFPREIKLAADERTNSLIASGPEAELNIIYHILTRLDEPDVQLKPQTTSPAAGATNWPDAASRASVAELTRQYDAKEQQAAELARQIRELQAGGKPDKTKLDKLSADLRRVVSEAFAARQQLHRAELGELQQRIAGVQQSLTTRERLSPEIIDRRVKDLLNPDLQWDADGRSRLPGGTSRAASSTQSRSSAEPAKGAPAYWWGPETETLLKTLGLQVQKLTAEDAPEPKLVGALKVTAIEPTSPASDLQVGDMIVALQSTGALGNTRRVMLNIVRGAERFPVTVEIPAATPSTVNPPRPDVSATLAYREKLRERVQLMERGYKAGEMPISELLRAKVQLDDAEVAAAASVEDRQAARRQKVEHLQELKTISDKLRRSGEANQSDMLAVEAELIKAEAELAAEQSSASSPPAPPALPEIPTVPSISLPAAGGSTNTLKSPSAFREELESAEQSLASIQRAMEKWQREGRKNEGPGVTSQQAFDNALKRGESRLAFSREEFAAQLRLLEIEVRDATNEFNTANNKRNLVTALFQSNSISKAEKVEVDRVAEKTKLRLERANTLLELYRKADPKNAPVTQPAESPGEAKAKR
jgi:hypothetical protein